MKPRMFKSPYSTTRYTVVTSEKMYRKLLKKYKLEYVQPNGSTCVITQPFRNSVISIACIFDHDTSADFRVGVLVHESVHVWQDFMGQVVDCDYSVEFEARTIREIFLNILSEYDRQVNETKTK